MDFIKPNRQNHYNMPQYNYPVSARWKRWQAEKFSKKPFGNTDHTNAQKENQQDDYDYYTPLNHGIASFMLFAIIGGMTIFC